MFSAFHHTTSWIIQGNHINHFFFFKKGQLGLCRRQSSPSRSGSGLLPKMPLVATLQSSHGRDKSGRPSSISTKIEIGIWRAPQSGNFVKIDDQKTIWLQRWLILLSKYKKDQLRFIGGKSRNRVKSRNPWFYYIPWFPPMYLDWSQNLPWHPNLSGLRTRKISIGRIPHLWDKNAPRTNLDPTQFLSRLWTRRVISPMAAAKRPFS